MKKLLSLFLLIAILLLSACSAQQPKSTVIEGAQRDKVLAYADPIADNLLTGMANNDYAAFSKDFNQKMKDAMGPDSLQKLRDQLDPRIGQYQSRQAEQVLDYGDLVTVTYNGVFEKAKNVKILLTFTKAEPHQVAGLYFQ